MELRRRLERAQWLGPLNVLLTVGLVLAGLNIVMQLVVLANGGQITVQVPTDHRLEPGPDGVPPDVLLDPGGTFRTYVREPTIGQAVLFELTRLPTLAAFVLILALVLRLVRRARQAGPFTAVTVRRLRTLAVVVMISEILADVIQSGAQTALLSSVTIEPFTPPLTLGSAWWWLFGGLSYLASPWLLLGFGFLAVAELIKRGHLMRSELAEVI